MLYYTKIGVSHLDKGKLKKESLSDQVCEILKKQILEKKWKAGEALPSEAQIAENFGVNRLTVRMALQKLSTMLLVYTKAGEGTFVREFDLQEYVDAVGDFYQTPKMIEDIGEFRVVLEKEWIRHAINNYDTEQIAVLEEIVDKIVETIKGQNIKNWKVWLDPLSELEYAFLKQLSIMSGNSVYPVLLPVVKKLVLTHDRSVYGRVHDGKLNLDIIDEDGNFIVENNFLRKILGCIKEKDLEKAWSLYDEINF